jgi:hypothetical protein
LDCGFVTFFALGLAMAAKFALPRTKIPPKPIPQKTLDSFAVDNESWALDFWLKD